MPAPSPSPAAQKAAHAAAAVVEQERQALIKSCPQQVAPGGIDARKLAMVGKAAIDAVKALGATETPPAWTAPKGVREWTQAVPIEVYLPAMLVLTIARKAVPPQMGAAFMVQPQDFTTDHGLDKVLGMLGQIQSDKKIQAAIHAGVDQMGAPGAAPSAAEGAEGAPNPDEQAPPHAEPDDDDLVSAGASSAPM